MIDSGCRPEWITLGKEIREDIADLRKALKEKREKLGPFPLTKYNVMKWEEAVKQCYEKTDTINGKIDKFNMIVPILNKQRVHIDGDREVLRVMKYCGYGPFQNQMNQSKDKEIQKEKNKSIVFLLLNKMTLFFKSLKVLTRIN